MLLHGHVKAWLAIAHFEQICDEGWRRGIPFHIIKSVTFLDRQQLVAMHVESVRARDGNSLILLRQRTKNNYGDLHQAHNLSPSRSHHKKYDQIIHIAERLLVKGLGILLLPSANTALLNNFCVHDNHVDC